MIYPSLLADKLRKHYDVIIVGAGPCGIATALNLSPELNVAIIESGGYEIDPKIQEFNIVEQSNRLIRERIEHTRARALGGTTHFWTGHITPLEPHEFAGDKPLNRWPIGYAELKPYYDKAANLFGVAPNFSLEYWDKDKTLQSAFGDRSLVSKVWQFNRRQFGEYFQEELIQRQNIDVFLKTIVIGMDVENKAIKKISAIISSREVVTLSAKHIVLAQGGLEIPRFLHLCAQDNPDAFKESRKNIGRFFCVHPHLFWGAALFTDKLAKSELMQRTVIDGHRVGTSLQINPEIIKERGWVDISVRQEVPRRLDDSKEYHSDLLGHLDYHRHQVMYDSVHVLMAMRPLANSQITLSKTYRDRIKQPMALVNLNIDDKTVADAKAATQFIGERLGMHDQGRLKFALNEFFTERFYHKGILTGHHYMCATRMSDKPRFGVVDADCRVFGLDNLYLAGPSVMSTPGSVNPTFTAAALAIRLAEHVNNRN